MSRIFFTIGSINIYWYSVLIVIAVIIGMIISSKEAVKTGLGKSFLLDLAFYLIPVSIVGARVYYVIFNFSEFENDLLGIFKIWEGGLAIYGAIIASILFIISYCKKKGKPILLALDVLAPSLILGQAIGRWGNFFNKEAYGPIATLSFLEKLHLPNFIINNMLIEGFYRQPTFLYESLWCILGFVILLILRKYYRSKYGILTFSYFIWYGIGRFFIEGLRDDSLYLGSLRISQLVSVLLIIIGIIGLIIIKLKKKESEEIVRI